MVWVPVVFLWFLGAVVGERLYETTEGHHRVHEHHERFDPPVYDGDVEDERDEHRGIQVVEDDVPEWVKLTFADKFIALGETEFLQFGAEDPDAVDKLDDADVDLRDQDDYVSMNDDDVDYEGKRKKSRHSDAYDQDVDDDEGSGDYEYFYSDDEEFDYDPQRDTLANRGEKPQARSAVHHRHKPHEIDLEALADDELDGEDDEDERLARAVHEHRDALKTHMPAVSIGINTKKPTWDEADATSLLEVASYVKHTKSENPSHTPGSRRAARLAQGLHRSVGSSRRERTPSFFGQFEAPPMAAEMHDVKKGNKFALGSRYIADSGAVRLNSNDPRLANRDVVSGVDGSTAFLEESSFLTDPDDLSIAPDAKRRARNHREWLHANEKRGAGRHEGVQLPKLQKHMYSNGLPVADWEVGYVDNVLKQFGYAQ